MPANQSAVAPVVAAVLACLRADVTIRNLTGTSPIDGGAGVYEVLAPSSAPYDYIAIQDAGATPSNACGRGWGWAVLLYLRATCRTRAAAKALASRSVALLDLPAAALSVVGYPSVLTEIVSEGPGFPEALSGESVHHYPVEVRVTVSTV